MSKRLAAIAACAAGCLGEEPPPVRDPQPPPIVARQEGVGPLNAGSAATLRLLREAFLGYEVWAVNNAGLEYHVTRSGLDLLFVVPDDKTGQIFNVHIVSRYVRIADHPWEVGFPLVDLSVLTDCECWGGQPVCYTRGDHFAVAFSHTCAHGDYATPDERAKLLGVPIAKVIWNPTPFLSGPID